jgi:hypothetical protein
MALQMQEIIAAKAGDPAGAARSGPAPTATQPSYADAAKLVKQAREQEEVDRSVIVTCLHSEHTTLQEQQEVLEESINNRGEVELIPLPSNPRRSNSSNSDNTSSGSRKAPQPRAVYKIKFSSREARRSYYKQPTWEALQRSSIRVRLPLTRMEQQHEWAVARPMAQLIRSSNLGLGAYYTGARIRVWRLDDYGAARHIMDTSRFTADSMPRSADDQWLQQWLTSRFSTTTNSNPSTPRAADQQDTADAMEQSPTGSRKQAAASTPDTVNRPPAKAPRREDSSSGERRGGTNRFAMLAGGSA